ncbi:hypothetical protein ACFLSW_05905 [Candidatus Bipolaricaulota bacterium]
MNSRRLLVMLVIASWMLALTSCELWQPPDLTAGMDDAIEVVTRDVIPEVVPEGADYVCLRLDDVLPPGSVIEEDVPEGQADAQGLAAPKALTLGTESYFFFLDLDPGAFYEHPVKYIVVDENGGNQVMDASWWPRINGQVPEPISDETPDSDYVIAGNVTLIPPTGVLMEFDFDLVLRGGEGFIVVQGLMSHENLFNCANNTYLNGIAFFNAYKSGFSQVEGLVQGQADNVLDEIDQMVQAKLNPITIYIIAHGGVDGIRLGGVWMTAQQFRNKMAAHPNTQFNFLLGSCGSGSFIDDLNTLNNVRLIKTACATNGSAYPDWDNVSGQTDFNIADNGSEWTSSLLQAASSIVSTSASWAQIQSLASTWSVPATSVLLDVAGHGALGNYASLGLSQDLDLSHRVGSTQPQSYRSWGILIPILPIIPITPIK